MKRKELMGLCLILGTCLVFSGCGGVSEEEQAKRDEAKKYEHTISDGTVNQNGSDIKDDNGQGTTTQPGGDNVQEPTTQPGGDNGQGTTTQPGGDSVQEATPTPKPDSGSGQKTTPTPKPDSGSGQTTTPKPNTGSGQGTNKDDDKKEEVVTFKSANDQISIKANELRLRTAPSLESDVYKMAVKGEVYKRTGIGSNGFDRLEVDGKVVYASAQFLEFYDPTAIKYPEVDAVDVKDKLYSYDDMQKDIDAIQKVFADIITVNEIATTADGRKINEIIVGDTKASKHVLITAGINGRDYITSQLVLSQLEDFLNSYYTGKYENVTYEGLAKKVALHIVPMVNPDGVAISQEGLEGIDSGELRNKIKNCYESGIAEGYTSLSFEDYLVKWKANANGVDLNRNFSTGWEDYFGIGEAGAEKYKGDEALSQPETVALAELTEKIKPVAVINYHTSGNIIYWNFEQSEAVKADSKALAEAVAKITGYEIDGWSSVDAATYSDWTAVTKKIPTIDLEVGTGSAPVSADSFATIKKANSELIPLLLYRYR